MLDDTYVAAELIRYLPPNPVPVGSHTTNEVQWEAYDAEEDKRTRIIWKIIDEFRKKNEEVQEFVLIELYEMDKNYQLVCKLIWRRKQ
jgi:hypothetical protein